MEPVASLVTEAGKDMKKILIVGGGGLLGSSLVKVITEESNWEVKVASRKFLADAKGYERWDSNSRSDWKEMILKERWKPDVIVNVAAMTNVDQCEIEREGAWKTNVELVSVIAEMARKVDAKVIQLSSDNIFDGVNGPYTEDDKAKPINYYGKTKLAAENVCLSSGIDCAIIRTMWLYGQSAMGKKTFVDWLIERVLGRETTRIAIDEIGNPTLTDDVAYAILKIIEKNLTGIVNIAGENRVSRWEWANRICDVYRIDKREMLVPVESAQLQREALRPLQSGFVTTKMASVLEFKAIDVEHGLYLLRIQKERETT